MIAGSGVSFMIPDEIDLDLTAQALFQKALSDIECPQIPTGKTPDTFQVLDDLAHCAASWGPTVRILGNVRADDMFRALRETERTLRDCARFLADLPADVGRGSLNGLRAQLIQRLSDMGVDNV